MTDKDWYDQEFPFYDEQGKQVIVSVKRIVELAEREYRYDDEPRMLVVGNIEEKAVKPKIVSVGSVRPMLKLSTRTFRKPLELTEGAKPRLVAALGAPPTDAELPAVLLRVEGIQPPKDVPLTFEVFLAKKGEKPSPKSYVVQSRSWATRWARARRE